VRPEELIARLRLGDGHLRHDLARLGFSSSEIAEALDPHRPLDARIAAVQARIDRFLLDDGALERAVRERASSHRERILASQHALQRRRARVWVLGLAAAVAVAVGTGGLVWLIAS
jgi:hypothetical protein